MGHFNCAIISEFSLQLLYWAINILLNYSYVNRITCAILSISSISRLTIAYIWSNGVGAVCILMTRVVSLTLINVYEITDEQKMEFLNYAKIAVHTPWPCLRVQVMAVFNLLLDCENTRLSYLTKKSCLRKKPIS